MKDLAFSKQIMERKDLFPWMKIFLDKLVKKFPNDFDKDILQFLIQNIEKEVNSLSNEEDTRRKEALFEVIYDLFLHFWWRIRWDGKKNWRKCWKIAYSEVTYSYDQRTKCFEKLLYCIIYLGIILSNGCFESEWTEKILKALHTLPSFDDMICNSLLRIKYSEIRYNHVYMAVLKHVFCSEVAQNISEPVTYMKIILLLRRLKKFTEDKETLSAIKVAAVSMKAPSDTSLWLSSLEINLLFKKHKNIAKILLSKKCPESIIRQLYQVITGRDDSKPKAGSHLNESEEMDILKEVSDLEHIQPNPHRSHSVKESAVSWHAKTTNVINTPSNNSKIKIRLNHKMLGGFNTTPNSVELNETETLKKKSKFFSNKKECNKVTSISKANKVNDFLNLSFAEISNFSEKPDTDSKNLGDTNMDNDVVPKGSKSSVYLSNENMSFSSKYKKKHTNTLLGKRMKLDSKSLWDNKIQTANNFFNNHETACSIYPVNPNANTCIQPQSTDTTEEYSAFSPIHSSDCLDSLNHNIFNKNTAETHNASNSNKKQNISLDKVPSILLKTHENQKNQKSALLKLVQPLEMDWSLGTKLSSNSSVENDTKPFEIDCKTPESDTERFYFELSDSNSTTLKELLCPLQDTDNSTQHCDVSLQVQNKLREIDFKLINSAIAENDASSHNCSTKNKCKNNGISPEKLSSIEHSSPKLCNDLVCSSPLDKNEPIACNDRSDKKELLSPATSKNLPLTKNHLTDSIKHSPKSSKTLQEDKVINKSTNESICIVQQENTSHCLVDCKIINDYDPNNSLNKEGPPSVKVFINVTCKSPKDGCNPKKEHIFGTFNDSSLNVTPDSPVSYFNALNPFRTEKSNSKMPNLTPYYDDLPFLKKSLREIATPPDSELDISIAGSIKKSNTEASTKCLIKKIHNTWTCSSTPKNAQSALSESILTDHSDFKTPNTSECESSNEWSLENTNLTNSLLLINSLQNSSADDVLKQLNSRTSFAANKDNTVNATSLSKQENKNVSYRSNADIYSDVEFSDDSTISCPSHISGSDPELKSTVTIEQKSRKPSKDTSKKKTKVVLSKRKNSYAKQLKSEDLHEDSSCIKAKRYNLRSRGNLSKPNKYGDFVTYIT